MTSTVQTSREEVRTFWTGAPLSNYEILSLKSFVATGARVILYSYEDDLAVPDGVELRDASEVLPGPVHEFRQASGEITLSQHSDIFRYVMLEKFGGWYADLDVICMTKQLPQVETYFAPMMENLLNTAVLKFPKGSSLLNSLLQESRRMLPAMLETATTASGLSIGPLLLTDLVKKLDLEHALVPRSRIYEIAYSEAMDFFEPQKCQEILARLAESDFTHLWNDEWRTHRVPKSLGPPKGSFLDVMFERHGIEVRERTRMTPDAVRTWRAERRLIKDIKINLNIETVNDFTIDEFAYSIQAFGWQPRDRIYDKWFHGIETRSDVIRHARTSHPQILRTFWHGDFINPYSLMCLRSFVDRGHRVEVFSYNTKMNAPAWLDLRDAAEILPARRVIVPFSEDESIIRDDLFRYAVLSQLGGWWVDPDIVLLKPDMPDCEIFFGESDGFGLIPTSLLKFPPGHPLIAEALKRTGALNHGEQAWGSGSPMLSALIKEYGLDGSNAASEPLGPVSWFNVPDLFDPSKAIDLSEKCAKSRLLHLQGDVWRRAGFPLYLAPPAGSYIDVLFARHDTDVRFPTRAAFEQINRWIRHMYKCAQLDRAASGLL